MKTYVVNVKEIWVQPVEVVAESKEEAIKKVAEGEGTYLNEGLEYVDTLDPSEWSLSGEYITA